MDLTDGQLAKLPTHRLLNLYRKRYKSLRHLGAAVTDYGSWPEHLEDMEDPEVEQYWKLDAYVKRIKAVLDTREHVER